MRRLGIGVAGLGRAFQLMLPTFLADPRVALTAAADPRPEARDRFTADFSARAYASVEEMSADPAVEAVYIATPHQFHAQNVLAAVGQGKHVLVEKPMALTVDECSAMVPAARQAGVHIVVGHSHSFDAPILRTRELIASGEFGPLRMISALNYTDFLYRARRPEELDTAAGGGVLYNQAPHHVDIVRFLGGGLVRSVFAVAGAWDRARPTEGAYSAILKFGDGLSATITYSGYAHFDSDELVDWFSEGGQRKSPGGFKNARLVMREEASADAEIQRKIARLYGGPAAGPLPQPPAAYQHFGLILASCEGADVRPTAQGVKIYADDTERFEHLPAPAIPRQSVIDELCAAAFDGIEPLHNGEWGRATMEVCLAMLESSRSGMEIALHHQVSTASGTK